MSTVLKLNLSIKVHIPNNNAITYKVYIHALLELKYFISKVTKVNIIEKCPTKLIANAVIIKATD